MLYRKRKQKHKHKHIIDLMPKKATKLCFCGFFNFLSPLFPNLLTLPNPPFPFPPLFPLPKPSIFPLFLLSQTHSPFPPHFLAPLYFLFQKTPFFLSSNPLYLSALTSSKIAPHLPFVSSQLPRFPLFLFSSNPLSLFFFFSPLIFINKTFLLHILNLYVILSL